MERFSFGIDVDKKTFKVCLLNQVSHLNRKVKSSKTFDNGHSGFNTFEVWINKQLKNIEADSQVCFVMEATGTYHEQLAYFLDKRDYQIHIVLPLKSKRYLQSLGLRSKNDQIDAKGLACMGLEQQLEVWEPASSKMLELRSLTRQIEALHQHKTAFVNQLEGVSHSAIIHPMVKKNLKDMITKIEREVEKLEKQVEIFIQKDECLSKKYKLFVELKGVGIMTFAVVVAETGGFALFKNQRQLVCYSGYDVMENQSGQRSGKTRISKKGNSHIRRILHMASLSAVRFKCSPFIELYQRVSEKTGIKMKGYVAVQRKLLVIMYTIWKKEKEFNPIYKDENSGIEEPKLLFSDQKNIPKGTH